MPSCAAGTGFDPITNTCVNCATAWEFARAQFASGKNPWPDPNPAVGDSPFLHAGLLPPRECPTPSWFTPDVWGWNVFGPPPAVVIAAARGAVSATDPTASGNMADLEAEYQKRKTVYDNLVQDALAKNDSSKIDAIASAKVAMNDSLNKMLEVSAQSGTESQQQELIHRIMEIQRDYNGLLVSTDKLQTLRLLHQSLDVRDSFGLKLLGGAFLFTTLALLVQVMRTR